MAANEKDIQNQLQQFGYEIQDIITAMTKVSNKNDVNQIIDQIEQAQHEIGQQSIVNQVLNNNIQSLMALGFEKNTCIKALQLSNNNVELASQYLVESDFMLTLNNSPYQQQSHNDKNDDESKQIMYDTSNNNNNKRNWSCKVCTFSNDGNSTKCEVCGVLDELKENDKDQLDNNLISLTSISKKCDKTNDNKSIISNCECLKRVCAGLQLFGTLREKLCYLLYGNTDEKNIFAKDKFIKFCENTYGIDVDDHDAMMYDYNHILKEHKTHLSQIGDELVKNHGFEKNGGAIHFSDFRHYQDKTFLFYVYFYYQCNELFFWVIGTEFEIKKMEIKLKDDEIWTDTAKSNYNNIIRFTAEMYDISIRDRYGRCTVVASYSDSETINHIIDKISKYINDKYNPAVFKILCIHGAKSFTEKWIFPDQLIEWKRTISITKYNKNDIINKGLIFEVEPHHKHQPKIEDTETNCTCENMQKLKSNNP
eukprot:312059_1